MFAALQRNVGLDSVLRVLTLYLNFVSSLLKVDAMKSWYTSKATTTSTEWWHAWCGHSHYYKLYAVLHCHTTYTIALCKWHLTIRAHTLVIPVCTQAPHHAWCGHSNYYVRSVGWPSWLVGWPGQMVSWLWVINFAVCANGSMHYCSLSRNLTFCKNPGWINNQPKLLAAAMRATGHDSAQRCNYARVCTEAALVARRPVDRTDVVFIHRDSDVSG